MFPSPLRGLIFHSHEYDTLKARDNRFRPLFGDLSSILMTQAERTKKKYRFPSPLRGLIFHSY